MMKKFMWVFVAACLVACPKVASAGEVDVLVQKLVEKGILSPNEGQIILDETKQEVAKQNAKGENDAIPSWIQTIKLKGDFRVRYQQDHTQTTTAFSEKERTRIRMRLGLEAKPNDKILVGVGLSTGKSDAITESADQSRSTNQSFDNGFSKYNIALDYAYAQYTPLSWVTLVGGKFKNPLWEPGDLIWDTDINPAGGALKLDYQLFPGFNVFMNTAALEISELTNSGKRSSPSIFAAQPGASWDIVDGINLKGAVSYYATTGVKEKHLYGTAYTNTLMNVPGGTCNSLTTSGNGTAYCGEANQFTNITPAVELTIKEPLKALGVSLPFFSVFGEYVENTAVSDRNTGYMGGVKFGDEKIAKFGDWQTRYNYAMLGRDSVLDILPDSDRFGGKTGMRSHEIMFDFGLGKNTWLGLDYYYGWQLPGSVQSVGSGGITYGSGQTKPAQVMQFDWNMKF